MRDDANAERVATFLHALGRVGAPGDRAYLAGGASAVTVGWRASTKDVDLRIEAQHSDALLREIAELKERLDVNVELAGPLDFLPEPAGWRDRSVYLGRFGAIDVFHTDFALQALAKLQRGLDRDLSDVDAMLSRELTTRQAIRETFQQIEPELYRFPAIDAPAFHAAVEAATGAP
jgi:hypothetical protein